MSKAERIKNFDPNGVGLKNEQFIGLPFTEEDAEVVLMPVPWDVTVSFAAGTASGPDNILECSSQLDLEDTDVEDAWKMGLYFQPVDREMQATGAVLRKDAEAYIDFLEKGGQIKQAPEMQRRLDKINTACSEMVDTVKERTGALMDAGKLVGLIGGDHSTPLGYLQALAERYDEFGILQIDAHMDLREAYEGFTYSHASIFYNALELEAINSLVQVGIRDYCRAEADISEQYNERISVFYDHELKAAQFKGAHWNVVCTEIIRTLPDQVYVSFDIDGLDPTLCPGTGTPVPGGLQYMEAVWLLRRLVESGRTIIGFDLCETAGQGAEWDGNVAARLAYKLANLMGKSNGRI